MSIFINGNQFHLRTKNTSYVMSVYNDTYLLHHHWGEALYEKTDLTHLAEAYYGGRATAFSVSLNAEDSVFLSDLKMEFSTVGGGDYRIPSVQIAHADGSTVTEFTYAGRPASGALPFSIS